jgi:hypothetical protein
MAYNPLDKLTSPSAFAVPIRPNQMSEGQRLETFGATLSALTREARAQATANLGRGSGSSAEPPRPAAMLAEGGNTESLDAFGASLQAMNQIKHRDFMMQASGQSGSGELNNPTGINGHDQNAIAIQKAAMTVANMGQSDAKPSSAEVYGASVPIQMGFIGDQRTVSEQEAAEINSQYAKDFESFKSYAKSGWDRYVAEGSDTKNLDTFGASCKSFLEMAYQDFMVLAFGPRGFGGMKNPEVINGYNQKAVADYAYSISKGLGDQFKAATRRV